MKNYYIDYGRWSWRRRTIDKEIVTVRHALFADKHRLSKLQWEVERTIKDMERFP